MHTRIISVNHPDALQQASEILLSGGLVAFPTDTVYGLGCIVKNASAINRLYQVKERSQLKAIAVLIADISDLEILTPAVPPLAVNLVENFWPGALTLIFPKHPELPANISPLSTIGIRMPDHEFARSLLRKTGPLATTSANISGQSNPTNAREVQEQLAKRIELILDGGETPGGVPSTVVDCTLSIPRIIRVGKLTAEILGLQQL